MEIVIYQGGDEACLKLQYKGVENVKNIDGGCSAAVMIEGQRRKLSLKTFVVRKGKE
jgi:hypothetical protein